MKRLGAVFLGVLSTSCGTGLQDSNSVGRLYHYIRTNQDGSEPEHVWVYRRSLSEVEVLKEVEPCTRAAYVTAVLDLKRNQPASLVGGKLRTDGSQEPFAFMNYAAEKRELSVRVPALKLDTQVRIEDEPWRIYDFDLADLTTLSAGHSPNNADFAFGMALIWPSNQEKPLAYLGRVQATFQANEQRAGHNALRFGVSGALRGKLWLDAQEGHVLEAQFQEPNHSEYKDFQLILQSSESHAARRWHEVRLDHWRGCKEK